MKKPFKNNCQAKAKQRILELEKLLKVKLPKIADFCLDEKAVQNHNCEQMIGACQIPLGIAGPLLVKNQKNKAKNYYLPLATTEGALVASVNRGAKAVTGSGGTTVFVENVGITRGPVFKTKNLQESFFLKEYLEKNLSLLKTIAKTTSEYLSLKNIHISVLGNLVYVRFYFDTSEAMGMNMATVATDKICQHLEKDCKITCLALSGNFCTDKKPSFSNILFGRGQKVWAEVVITKEIISQVLKTTAEDIYSVWLNKNLLGSMMAGAISSNAHFANILAALFLSTGQDPGHLAESSVGFTQVEITKSRDLYFSIYLPDLIIGVVGGGTGLATQKEAFDILGIEISQTDKGKEEFAGVIAGAVLSGELSLLSALSSGDLAKAHKRLGQGEK